MAWSYSALKEFEGCNRRYHEVKVLKKYPFVKGEEALYGDMVHKAAELYVTEDKPIPEEYSFIQPFIDTLLQKKGTVYAEFQMALKADLTVCDWWDKKAWVRSKADLLIVDGEAKRAWMVDYKTGKATYPDKDQLKLMSAMLFSYFPVLERVNSALAFVVKDVFIKDKLLKENVEKTWWDYRERVAKIDKAHASGVWNPTSSGLCRKHCPVTSCEFNGRS